MIKLITELNLFVITNKINIRNKHKPEPESQKQICYVSYLWREDDEEPGEGHRHHGHQQHHLPAVVGQEPGEEPTAQTPWGGPGCQQTIELG